MILTKQQKRKMEEILKENLTPYPLCKAFMEQNTKLEQYTGNCAVFSLYPVSEPILNLANANIKPIIEEVLKKMTDTSIEVIFSEPPEKREIINGAFLQRQLDDFRDNIFKGFCPDYMKIVSSPQSLTPFDIGLNDDVIEKMGRYSSYRRQIIECQIGNFISAITFKPIKFSKFEFRFPSLEGGLYASVLDLRKMRKYKNKIGNAFIKVARSCLQKGYSLNFTDENMEIYEEGVITVSTVQKLVKLCDWCEMFTFQDEDGDTLWLQMNKGNPNNTDEVSYAVLSRST